jgi:hypothetical protein
MTISTQARTGLPNQERIILIKSYRWIGYPRAREILAKLDALHDHPEILRMPNLLIVADTNNGKTQIVSKFFKSHMRFMPPDDTLQVTVLMVDCPPVPDEKRLYSIILQRLNAPHNQKASAEALLMQIQRLFAGLGMRMLILDEIQHTIAGSSQKQRAFLNVIKSLGNRLKIPIVAAGTKTALNAISSDDQLSNRFEPIYIPLWREGEDFFRLVASFEKMLPLKEASNLSNPALARRILAMSEGTIGEISSVINKAAILAIETGEECITESTLQKISWTPPSERRRIRDA